MDIISELLSNLCDRVVIRVDLTMCEGHYWQQSQVLSIGDSFTQASMYADPLGAISSYLYYLRLHSQNSVRPVFSFLPFHYE